MEMIAHEFTDSLSNFLRENPSLNEKDWLKQLNPAHLSLLVDLLRLVFEGRGIPGIDENDCLNQYTDAHLLAFKVNNIGKKRHISKLKPEKQVKLIGQILVDAQLALISPKII